MPRLEIGSRNQALGTAMQRQRATAGDGLFAATAGDRTPLRSCSYGRREQCPLLINGDSGQARGAGAANVGSMAMHQ